MAVVGNRKARLPSLGGKGVVGYQGADSDSAFIAVYTPPFTVPTAFAYFDSIGVVDLREQYIYFERQPGEVGLYIDQEAPTFRGGWYFNRE